VSLGFSVEALLPRARGGGALRMGLVRLAEDQWLQPEFDRSARAGVFADHPESVQLLPEAEAPAREVAHMLGVDGGLAEAGRAVWEDLCILTRAPGSASYRLTGGAVGFPTDWRLGDKLGLPLTAVHAPIHGYAEQLAAGVDHLMATLEPGAIFGRANWFLVASDALRYMPTDDPRERFSHVGAANAGNLLFIRCERQTLRRLPHSGAILFTIGVDVARLGSLSGDLVSRVAASVMAVGVGEHERRAAPFYADALTGYAARR
jgi:hypothetical protein